MQYLKTFQIPSDGWVNWYFTPWNTDIYPPPLDLPDPDNFIHPNKASFHNTWYPWNVFENPERIYFFLRIVLFRLTKSIL